MNGGNLTGVLPPSRSPPASVRRGPPALNRQFGRLRRSAYPKVFGGFFPAVGHDFVAHLRALIQIAQTCSLDGRDMDKHILAASVGLNKSRKGAKAKPRKKSRRCRLDFMVDQKNIKKSIKVDQKKKRVAPRQGAIRWYLREFRRPQSAQSMNGQGAMRQRVQAPLRCWSSLAFP